MSFQHKHVPVAALHVGIVAAGLSLSAYGAARAQEVSSPANPPEAGIGQIDNPQVAQPPMTASKQEPPKTTIEQIDNPQVFNLWLDPENYPRIERAVNVMNARTTRARALNFLVDHRTLQPFQTNAFQDWVGFDAGGLRIGLSLRYGILDNLEVGAERLSNGFDTYDTYQFDVKYWALNCDRFFVDVAVRAGATWYAVPQAPDSGGGFAQLIVSRSLREYLWVSSGLLYHSNATNKDRASQDPLRSSGQAYALAIPVALEVRLQTFLAWDAEASFNVAGYHSKYPVLSTAFKIISNRHTFALIMSNSQYITADGLVANTSLGIHDLIVGFTITREFNL
jgi:Membrane bound beta barrel domain (DUF5777)